MNVRDTSLRSCFSCWEHEVNSGVLKIGKLKKWTDKWLSVLLVGGMKPMCLICSDMVAVVKSSSVMRHYETTHMPRTI